MDARSIALLEFPAVRDRLAAMTSFPPGRRLAEAQEPSADPELARWRDTAYGYETDHLGKLLCPMEWSVLR